MVNKEIKIANAFTYLLDLIKIIKSENISKISDFYLIGGRYSAKSLSLIYTAIMLLLMDCDIQINFFRNLKNSVYSSVYTDFINAISVINPNFDKEGLMLNKTHYFIRNNQCEVKFIGLHQSQHDVINSKGLANVRQKYILNVFEECYEIDKQDTLAVNVAQRGTRIKQIFNVYIANPDFINKPIIKYFTQVLPEDIELLKSEGQQIKIIDYQLFHRTNRRCNELYQLNPNLENAIKEMYIANPELAKSWDYGLAGIGKTGIFTHLLKYIQYCSVLDVKSLNPTYFAGLDFGFKKNAFACLLMALSPNRRDVCVVSEFYFLNEKTQYSHEHINNLLLDWLDFRRIELNIQDRLVIRGDNADLTWIEDLNRMANARNYKWLSFQPCKKLPLQLRFGHLFTLMGRNSFVMVKHNTQNLMNELMSSVWSENSEKPVDKDDHLIDALNYAIQPYLTQLGSQPWSKNYE